jgi:hypothetical protein
MFLEFGPVHSAEAQESIFSYVDENPLPDVAEVLKYLGAGHVLIDFMDIADDVFDPSEQVMNGSTVLTDGDWLWRRDTAYYLRFHNVRLPDEFLELIRARRYVVPHRDVPVLRECSQEAMRLMS